MHAGAAINKAAYDPKGDLLALGQDDGAISIVSTNNTTPTTSTTQTTVDNRFLIKPPFQFLPPIFPVSTREPRLGPPAAKVKINRIFLSI